MRIIRFFVSFLFFSQFCIAIFASSPQPRFIAGLNVSQHYGVEYGYEEYEVEKGIRWGTSSGFALDFPITDNLTISQEFLFTNKGSKQKIGIKGEPIELDVYYKTDYLEFPAIFRLFHFRHNDFVLFYQTGFALSYMINARYELSGLIETGTGDHVIDINKKIQNIDRFDFGFILGGGANFKMMKKLFSLDYRINFGIPFLELPTTEDVFRDLNDTPRVKLRNQSYSLSINYYY